MFFGFQCESRVNVMKNVAGLLLVLGLIGCGTGGPVPQDNKDPELYAADVKRVVLMQVEEARRSREPGDEIYSIVSELENYEKRPAGSYASIYSELREKAKELQAKCEEVDGRPSDLASRLDELVELANQLPGEVKVDSERRRD